MKKLLLSTLILCSSLLFSQSAIGQQLSIKEGGSKTKTKLKSVETLNGIRAIKSTKVAPLASSVETNTELTNRITEVERVIASNPNNQELLEKLKQRLASLSEKRKELVTKTQTN